MKHHSHDRMKHHRHDRMKHHSHDRRRACERSMSACTPTHLAIKPLGFSELI